MAGRGRAGRGQKSPPGSSLCPVTLDELRPTGRTAKMPARIAQQHVLRTAGTAWLHTLDDAEQD